MEVCKGECMGDEPLTLTGSHSCGLSQLFEAYNLKGIKFKIYFFFSLALFSFSVAHFMA